MDKEMMPILPSCRIAGYPSQYPMEMFNEEWANKIHGQTLTRLKERGGLSANEMLVNIYKSDYKELFTANKEEANIKMLLLYCNKYIMDLFMNNTPT